MRLKLYSTSLAVIARPLPPGKHGSSWNFRSLRKVNVHSCDLPSVDVLHDGFFRADVQQDRERALDRVVLVEARIDHIADVGFVDGVREGRVERLGVFSEGAVQNVALRLAGRVGVVVTTCQDERGGERRQSRDATGPVHNAHDYTGTSGNYFSVTLFFAPAQARSAQADRKHTPPIGVIAPSQRTGPSGCRRLVRARR